MLSRLLLLSSALVLLLCGAPLRQALASPKPSNSDGSKGAKGTPGQPTAKPAPSAGGHDKHKQPPPADGAKPSDTKGGAKDSAVQYTCPMHPEVVQATPGRCPQCGMNLEQKAPAAGSPAAKDNTPASQGAAHDAHKHH